MSNKRIDLEKLNDDLQHGNPEVNISDLIAELKRCYEEIDGFEETVEQLVVAEDVLGRSAWSDVYYQELEERLYE